MRGPGVQQMGEQQPVAQMLADVQDLLGLAGGQDAGAIPARFELGGPGPLGLTGGDVLQEAAADRRRPTGRFVTSRSVTSMPLRRGTRRTR